MSVTVKRWRLENAEVELIGLNGVRVVETIVVYGLTTSTDDKILYDAISQSGIPTYATAHRYYTTAFVNRIRILAISDTQVKLQVTYETPQKSAGQAEHDKFVFSDDTSLESTTTQKDAQGNPLKVTYERFVNGESKWKRSLVGNAQILVPRRTLTASAVMTIRPNTAMRLCVGRVNASRWQDEPQRTWLCSRVAAVSRDLEQTYEVTASFIHNEETWDAYEYWVDENGNIPGDVDSVDTDPGVNDNIDANGVLRAIIYQTADFSSVFGG